MHTPRPLIFPLLLSLLIGWLPLGTQAQPDPVAEGETARIPVDVHTWTSLNGHTFEGRFVRMEMGNVTLAGKDGKTVTLPLAALDPASARLARKEAERLTPLFLRETPKYTFEVRKQLDGFFLLRLKEAGKTIPYYGEMSFNLKVVELRGKENGRKEKVDIPLKRVLSGEGDRDGATLRLQFENGVVAVVRGEALDDGIEFSYVLEKPDKEIPELISCIWIQCPALLEWELSSKTYKGPLSPSGVPSEKLESALSGYLLRIKKAEGGTEKIKFHDPIKGLRGERFIMETPGRQNIEFRAGADALLASHTYDGDTLMRGFRIRFESRIPFDSSPPKFQVRLD